MKFERNCRKILKELLLDLYDFRRRLPKAGPNGSEPTTLPNPSWGEGIRVIQTAEAFEVITVEEGGKLRSWVYSLTTEMATVKRNGKEFGVEITKPYVNPTPNPLTVKPITETQIMAMDPIPDYPI